MKIPSLLTTGLLAIIGLGLSGCATNAGNGALIGGAAGAGAGALLTHGHPGGIIVGGALGAITGAVVGHEVDRDEAYRNRYYYDGYYHSAPPPYTYETRTVVQNPDGTTTTYIDRTYSY